MEKRKIVSLLENEFDFFNQFPLYQKRKFLKYVLFILKSEKIRVSAEGSKRELAMMQIAILLARMLFMSTDKKIFSMIRGIEVCNPISPEETEARLQKFTVSVIYRTENFIHHATRDLLYGVYHCILSHSEVNEHFVDQLGRFEMLMIDRADFKTSDSIIHCIPKETDSPLSIFASFNELFFNHPKRLQQSDPEMYIALCHLWLFNPLQIAIPPPRQFVPVQKSANSGLTRLHPVYYYTLISFFLGTLLFFLVFNQTLVTWHIPVAIIAFFSSGGWFFIKVFKRNFIPILKFPFVLFSIFGLGVNTATIIFALNYFITFEHTEQELIFPEKNTKKISVYQPENSAYVSHEVDLYISKNIRRRVTFKVYHKTHVKYYILKTRKGLFGFPVIKERTYNKH